MTNRFFRYTESIGTEAEESAMARPGELAEVIARVLGLPEQTVRQQARELRDAGLMAKERAGRGAGTLTSADAAALLIGVLGSLSVKDTPTAVDTYSTLPRFVLNEGYDDELYRDPAFNDFPLRELPRNHAALEAIRVLIEGQIRNPRLFSEGGSFSKFIRGVAPEFDGIDLSIVASDAHPSFEMLLYRPKTTAMWVYRQAHRDDTSIDFRVLKTSRSCSGDVLIEVANLLREDL